MTYQTKRQLRRELHTERILRHNAETARGYARGDLREFNALAEADGWEPKYADGFYRGEIPIVGWTPPNREMLELKTRRETLRAVVEALELKEYGAGPFGGLGFTGRETDMCVDAFWEDLQTTIAVRSERKAAEKAAATEGKVAGLTKNAGAYSLTFIPTTDLFDPESPTVDDLKKGEEMGGAVRKMPAAKKGAKK